jgi:hypothetical protein
VARSTDRNDRLRYIEERLHTDWGWVEYEKVKGAKSLRDIAAAVSKAFGDAEVHPMTIRRDINLLRDRWETPSDEEMDEAQRLLLPENFPEWRRHVRPKYDTPIHHHMIFYLMHSLTHKVELPQFVIDWFDQMDPERPLPENINQLIMDEDEMLTFQLLVNPRGGKTDLTIDFMIHAWCVDKDSSILWGNGSLKKTENFGENAIKFVLESHQWLNKMYGPFQADDRPWAKSGLKLRGSDMDKGMSLQPFGVSSNIRSYDADIIIADDLIDKRRAESPTQAEADFEWVTTELFTRREGHTSVFHIGSHLPIDHGDIFEAIEDASERINIGNHTMVIKKLPAHDYEKCDPKNDPDHKGCVLWPKKRGYRFLEGMRGLLKDDVLFEAIYNQIPRSRSMLHFPADIMRNDWWQPEPEEDGTTRPPRKDEQRGTLHPLNSVQQVPTCCKGQKCVLTLGFDPAGGKSKDSAFTAVVVLAGCPYCGRRYLVDFMKLRQSPELHPWLIEDFIKMYPDIATVRIEITALQTAISRDPRMQELEVKYGFFLDEYDTDQRKWDPKLGIPQLARHVKSGMLGIPYRTLGDQEYVEEFIKELIRWPKKPTDLVMAFWFADQALMELIDDIRNVAPEVMPGHEKYVTEAHLENMEVIDLSLITADGEYEPMVHR